MRKARPVELTPAETRFRLPDWIDRHMVVIDKSGPEWLCVCPVCGGEKFAVHVGRRAFQCLRASCRFRSWRPSVLVAAVLNVDVARALDLIAAEGSGLGPVPPLVTADGVAKRRVTPLPPASLPPVVWGLLPSQLGYVRSRGISDEHARLFGLATVVTDHTRSKADRLLSGRVFFPVWAPSGRMVFWCARVAGPADKAKVINMPRSCREVGHGEWCACYHAEWGLPPVPQAAAAGEVVLGLHLVRPGQPVVVVEGPVDAAVCGPGFVATLGAHMTPQQAALIANSGASEAIVLYDGDAGGEDGAPKAADLLADLIPTRYGTCPPGTDPGQLGRARSLQLAQELAPVGAVGGLQYRGDRSPKTAVQPSFIRGLQEK